MVVAAELDDGDMRHFDVLACCRNAGRHEIDLAIVGETDQELVNQPIGTDGAADRDDARVGGEPHGPWLWFLRCYG